jgi:hypothetical protein
MSKLELDRGVITSIHRYPVKGLNADTLTGADLAAGRCIPFDRAYAIENGGHLFDSANPHYLPKNKFLMLMSHERLANLDARFDEETQMLRLLRDGKQVAQGRLDQRIGRQLLEQFFSAYMSNELRGAPRIVHARDHSFSDAPEQVLSLINLASVHDLERVIGKPIDPMRFRGNLYVGGLKPWVEFDWQDAELEVPSARLFRCQGPIDRCAAINVDPQTGARDMAIPRSLMAAFGHMDLGVFVKVVCDGRIETGDPISLV